MIKITKIVSFATAAAVIGSITLNYPKKTSYQDYSGNSVVSEVAAVKDVSAEVVSAEQNEPFYTQLANACEQKDPAKISAVCDTILSEMESEKSKIQAYAEDINKWADDEIKERQAKYESEVNVKYVQVSSALEELKNGIDTEKNLETVKANIYVPEEPHYSDATPSIEASARNIDIIPFEGEYKGITIQSPPASSDDLKYDGPGEMPDLLTSLTAGLKDVNSIYHFVKDHCMNEDYCGSKKGALVTLAQFGGNDIDQASLLVNLLRSQDIPARYVRGMIYITYDQAKDLTGASEVNAVGRVLATGHRNVRGVSNNGTIVGYKMEHTWVEAYIPYTDYRGAGNMSGDGVWVQLDPSFKKVEIVTETVESEFTETDKKLIDMVNEYKEENALGEATEMPDTIDTYYRKIIAENDTYIPSSLPYTTLSVDERYDFIKDSDKDKISIYIDGEHLMSAPVSEIYGQPIIVSYEPASDYDRQIINHYDNLVKVPAYLVNVVPVVTVGSTKYKIEDDDIGWIFETRYGTTHQMVTSVTNCGGTTMMNDNIVSGSMYAINLDLQRITPDDATAAKFRMDEARENYSPKNMCSSEELGAFLDYAGKYYFALCDTQSDFYEKTMNISKSRRLALAITGYKFARSEIFGVTSSLDFGSFYIDVAYNSVAAISLDGDTDKENLFNYTCGNAESYLEGYIWEKLIDESQTCISTIAVMDIAAKQGIEFEYLTKNNAEAVLAKCNITNDTKNDIRNFVNQGLLVELVPETLKIGDWTGTAYIAIDLKTGSASYMISGGNAGGSSMEFEDLFELNNSLFLLNWEIADMSLLTAYKDVLVGTFSCDGKSLISGVHGCFSAAFALSSALEMRYANYHYNFEYAEKGEEIMKDYKIFTLVNLLDTVMSVTGFVLSLCGDAGSMASAVLGAAYDTAKAIAEPGKADTETKIVCIWDWIGVALASKSVPQLLESLGNLAARLL